MNRPPQRVQIVPFGYEYARISDPIAEWKADKVILINHLPDEHLEADFQGELRQELRESDSITLEERYCDLFDLYDALGTIAGTINDNAGNHVSVNVSTGSKITAIAGMIACMATEATPFYVRAPYNQSTQTPPQEPNVTETGAPTYLPTYPIESPDPQHVTVLDYIESQSDKNNTGRYKGVPKKELIQFGEKEGLPFITQSQSTSDKGRYRLLEKHITKPLDDRGYIEIEEIGRQKYVSLTHEGENTLEAFRYLLE